MQNLCVETLNLKKFAKSRFLFMKILQHAEKKKIMFMSVFLMSLIYFIFFFLVLLPNT